jgi:hypothetical protein
MRKEEREVGRELRRRRKNKESEHRILNNKREEKLRTGRALRLCKI